MARFQRISVSILGVLFSAGAAHSQSAIFKENSKTSQWFVDVVIDAPIKGSPRPLTIELFKVIKEPNSPPNRVLIQRNDVTPTPVEGEDQAKASLVLEAKPESNAAYKLTVSSGGIRWLDYDVERFLKAEFFTEPGHQCPGAIAMRLSGGPEYDRHNLEDMASRDFWKPVLDYLLNSNPGELATVRITSGGRASEDLGLRSFSTKSTLERAYKTGQIILCLDPRSKPPTEEFNLEVKFVKPNMPLALTEPFVGEELSGDQSPSLSDMSAEPGTPGERQLERNLDLGISFTSFRDPDTEEHNNRGVMDIRLAPWLNSQLTAIPRDGQRWFSFWTPIYLDANVATGPIVKETLSLNRVEIGSQVELRYLPFKTLDGRTQTGHYTTFHRFALSAKHASDRDFKQDEFAGSVEYQPVFAALNHPLKANWTVVGDEITHKPVFRFKSFGWEFKPKIGFEIGRTYARRNPAEALKPSDTARRVYSGLDIILNLTQSATLTLADTYFIRGEFAENRLKNHFKGEFDLLLGRLFREASHGIFVLFERGNKPPFDSPDVNSFRIGYRIRSQGWFGLRR